MLMIPVTFLPAVFLILATVLLAKILCQRSHAPWLIASSGGLVLLALCLVFLRFDFAKTPPSGSDRDAVLVERLSSEIFQKELFRDPDLTLNKSTAPGTIFTGDSGTYTISLGGADLANFLKLF